MGRALLHLAGETLQLGGERIVIDAAGQSAEPLGFLMQPDDIHDGSRLSTRGARARFPRIYRNPNCQSAAISVGRLIAATARPSAASDKSDGEKFAAIRS